MLKKILFAIVVLSFFSCSSSKKTVKNEKTENKKQNINVKDISHSIKLKVYEKYYDDKTPLYSIEGKIVTLKDIKDKYPDFAKLYTSSFETKKAEFLRHEIYSYLKSKNIKDYKLYLPLKRYEIENNEMQTKGNKNAPFTVVVYSDFQCPYCSRFFNDFEKQLMKKDDVKIIFKHFPLPFHENAKDAAIASICAGKQGKFWAFHDKLFENQQSLSDNLYLKIADEIKLDKTKFMQCLTDKATMNILQKDMEEAKKNNVKGTPTYFVNGVLYDKERTLDAFNKIYKNYKKSENEVTFEDLKNKNTVIFEVKGKKYTIADFFRIAPQIEIKFSNKIANESYELLKKVVENDVLNTVFTKEAEKNNFKDPKEFMQQLISKEVKEPEDKDIRAIYEAYKDRLQGATYEQVKPKLKSFLMDSKIRTFIKNKTAELVKKYNVIPLLVAPKFYISYSDNPILGSKSALNTVFVFSDFQCPYCARISSDIEKLANDKDIKVVYKFFPLSFHKSAMPAAIAAYCAYKQGKFWQFHDKLFENQGDLKEDNFIKWAKELKLDIDKFKKCATSEETVKRIKKDVDEGFVIGVAGTPSIYVNGRIFDEDTLDAETIKEFAKETEK